jgi:apolipoprotein D and lipocalin family protein
LPHNPTKAVIAAFALTMSSCAPLSDQAAGAPPLTTIASLDVPRYMGVWHEIAKYPNWFQAKCVRETSARYTLQSDGTVEVINRCRRGGGEWDEAIGSAYQVGAVDSPKLKVRFAPVWLSWLPAVWGNYWVIDIDEGYSLVAISEPTREYLWILSRIPTADPVAYKALLQRLAAKGFDLTRLQGPSP